MSSMESLVVHLRAATASLPAPLLGFGCHAREACFAVPTHLLLDRRRFVCRHYVFLPTTTIIQFARTGALGWMSVWAAGPQPMRHWVLPLLLLPHLASHSEGHVDLLPRPSLLPVMAITVQWTPGAGSGTA